MPDNAVGVEQVYVLMALIYALWTLCHRLITVTSNSDGADWNHFLGVEVLNEILAVPGGQTLMAPCSGKVAKLSSTVMSLNSVQLQYNNLN